MHAGVWGELGMEGGGQDPALAHQDGDVAFARQHFHARAQPLKPGGADENHLQRLFPQPGLAEADGAFRLPPVGVAPDANVQRPQTGLRRILHLLRQKDGAGAGAEGRLGVNELTELFQEAALLQELQEGGGLDRKSTRLNSSHIQKSRMPSSA